MIIKAYDGLPRTYAPDVGEVVLARRTKVEAFLRAVVLMVKRRRDGAVRIKVQWLDSDPEAGAWVHSPIVAGTVGWVVETMDPTEPRMVQQITRGQVED
jgi:hypothetical protein